MTAPPPIYADACALSVWVLRRFGEDPGALAHALCRASLGASRAITLAVKGRDRDRRLFEADDALVTVRLYLRLAEEAGLLEPAQTLHGLDLADQVGRQLGGWLRSLGEV